MNQASSNAESINRKLVQEEEWLKNFEYNVKKSAQLREGIETIIDHFQKRLTSLEKDVLPMHEINGRLQVKQHNIQRLIKTIDATVQYYGRTNELESSIRDGSPAHDLEAYLDHMECLQQAVEFFESHPNYKNQTENMKITLETGYTVLEKEYRNVVQKKSLQADAVVVIEALDDQFELMGNRAKEIRTVRDVQSLTRLGTWLLERGRTRFLNHYAEIRGDNMMRTISAVAKHHMVLHAKMHSRSAALKSALKKAAGRSERIERREIDGGETDGALVMSGCLLALLEVEEAVMVKTIPDTSSRAQVFRELVSRPLGYVVRHTQKVVQESDAGVVPLLPLLRFLSAHQTRLQNLATNSMAIMGEIPFESLMLSLRRKASTYINEFVEKLKNDTNKFVPLDGNVHPVTANTLNFLANLTVHRHTVTQQLLSTAPQGQNTAFLLPKLFARILSALGMTLKKKCENYDDIVLSTLFLLNNYNYIARALEDEEDGLLPVISEQNSQILSFYQSEIAQYVAQYMRCWNPTLATLSGVERIGDDKNQVKNILVNFGRELEQTVLQQKDYCISDVRLRNEVKDRVKQALVPPYVRLLDKTTGDASFAKYIKYTEESLIVNIDRLFDVAA